MPDRPNYASLHKPDLIAAIRAADLETLIDIETDLAREGWSADGRMRKLIAQRRSEIQVTS